MLQTLRILDTVDEIRHGLKSGQFRTIYTELAPASTFWRAEEYHQDYYKKNPLRYGYYRLACGRDARVARIWGPER